MAYPEPRLSLTATVEQSDTGNNLAVFHLAHAKTTGITVQLDPGDGTTTVDMAIGADGTASGDKLYTHTGHHTYTATVTVPMDAHFTSWEQLSGALATWDALADDTATWGDVTATGETATCAVEVVVGGGAVWATAVNTVTPPYAQIDTWSGTPARIASWTVTRSSPSVPALDGVMIYASDTYAGALSMRDNEVPWGAPVQYVWQVTYTDGSVESFTSNTVWVDGGQGFGGCWVTDPATGKSMRVTIQEWTEREREARQTVLEVMNRADPVVLSDVHTLDHGDITFLTRNQSELTTLRTILYGSRLILVRSWAGSSIEAAYMAVGNVKEARLYPADPYAWHRAVTVTVQDVRPVPATARDQGSTWTDLAAWYATWQDVDAEFPSWADVIAWNPDLASLQGPAPRLLEAQR